MSDEKLRGMQAEAEILRSLDHPYVVRLYDMFVSPGKAIYLVMELIRGGDLFDRIVEKERYTEVEARRLFRRILAAVYYLHEERGIVHRDLKPENILVVDKRNDVNIKLTDFGLAKNMTAEGLKTFCGTPQYFAPEVLRRQDTVKGDGRYGKEIDCWSIGVVLFILLSGSPPFDVSASFDAVASAEVTFHDDQWRDVSSDARDLVSRLLEKDPDGRMSVKDACRHGWVLTEDGDTHCHPLHDPLVGRKVDSAMSSTEAEEKNGTVPGESECDASSAAAKSITEDHKKEDADDSVLDDAPSNQQINSDEKEGGALDAPPRRQCKADAAADSQNEKGTVETSSDGAAAPSRKTFAPVDVTNALSPLSSQGKNATREKFVSKSAPQLSKQLSNMDVRRPSIRPSHANDKTVSKTIQQACNTQPSPNGSPIKKRQLFDGTKVSKATKQHIDAAGSTLPKPVLSEESRLVKRVPAPKKKVQSTLFSSDAGNKQCEGSRSASQLPQNEAARSIKKRKGSAVTPPGNEQSLVFQLNKKHKVGGKGGKYISPETRENVTATAAATSAASGAPARKKHNELPEDELQSDFSDEDEAPGPPRIKSDKEPIEKFLQKRKMESIDSSTTSVADTGNKFTQQKPQQSHEDELPRPVSKDCEATKNHLSSTKEKQIQTSTTAKRNDRKLVQSFLFGRPPPKNDNNNESPEEWSPKAPGDDAMPRSDQMQADMVDKGPGLHRQSSEEPNSAAGTTFSKGNKQRTIKSWFQPKK